MNVEVGVTEIMDEFVIHIKICRKFTLQLGPPLVGGLEPTILDFAGFFSPKSQLTMWVFREVVWVY